MDKSPDAYRTISEVADELGLPQHVLRFWETRFPHIKPLKRGGGRRYYRPDDIDLIRGIQTLLYSEGYTIKGVQRILKEDGVKPVQMVGRGSTYTGERQDADHADDDDVMADDVDVEDETISDLRATRDEPNLRTPSPRKATVLSQAADEPAAPQRLMATPSRVGTPQPQPHARKMTAPTSGNALQIAFIELQECARLIDLLREKA